MTRSMMAPIALATTLLFAAHAHADELKFAGFANGSQSVNVALSGPNAAANLTTEAGGFTASFNTGASFTTYCIDLYQYIGFGTSYGDYSLKDVSAHAFSNANAAADIGKLYGENNLVNSATTQAAFQIAIWEIAYETSGAYDLGTGSAKFFGGTADPAALALAGNWLAGLSSSSGSAYKVWALDSATRQDQVFATPVPEPTTYALMAGGLLCMAFVAKRRARQS
jgi:PEP-CTERM motif